MKTIPAGHPGVQQPRIANALGCGEPVEVQVIRPPPFRIADEPAVTGGCLRLAPEIRNRLVPSSGNAARSRAGAAQKKNSATYHSRNQDDSRRADASGTDDQVGTLVAPHRRSPASRTKGARGFREATRPPTRSILND